MFDFTQISHYRENNRLEAKLATGGLPHSIWETYSAFANSYGGVILLGVEELPDRSLRVQGLLDPQELVEEFTSLLSDPKVVSVNLLKEEDIQFLAESAFADACCPGNPRDTSVEEIKELYRSLM